MFIYFTEASTSVYTLPTPIVIVIVIETFTYIIGTSASEAILSHRTYSESLCRIYVPFYRKYVFMLNPCRTTRRTRIDVYNEKKTLPPKLKHTDARSHRLVFSIRLYFHFRCLFLFACWFCVWFGIYSLRYVCIAFHNTLKNANGFVACLPVSCNFNHSAHTFIQTLCSLCHRASHLYGIHIELTQQGF